MSHNESFDTLIIGSGGVFGFAYLGVLDYLADQGILNNIKQIGGTSIGSVISLLIASGMKIKDIYLKSDEFLMPEYNIPEFRGFSLESIPKSLFTFDGMRRLLSSILIDRFGYIPTMKSFVRATGIEYRTVSTSLDPSKPTFQEMRIISSKTDPDLSVIDAAIASCAIPFIFERIELDGFQHIDGAFFSPCPFNLFEEGRKISIYVLNGKSMTSPFKNLPQIVTARIYSLERIIDQISPNPSLHIAVQFNNYIDMLDMHPSQRVKAEMLDTGYEQAKETLTKSKEN